MTLQEIQTMLSMLRSTDTEMQSLGLTIFSTHFPHLAEEDSKLRAIGYLTWKYEQVVKYDTDNINNIPLVVSRTDMD